MNAVNIIVFSIFLPNEILRTIAKHLCLTATTGEGGLRRKIELKSIIKIVRNVQFIFVLGEISYHCIMFRTKNSK